MGSDLTSPNFFSVNFGGTGPSTVVQTALSGRNTVSPVSGTVIQWKVQGAQGGPLRFQVIRLVGGQFRSVISQFATITGPGVLTFPSHLRISSGDLIGVSSSAPSDHISLTPSTPSAMYDYFAMALTDGGAGQPPTSGQTREMALQATVATDCTVPNLKGLKLGAAQTTITAAGCTNGTVTKPKKKSARKKAKFVVSQSPSGGQTVEGLTPVDVTLGKKPKKKK